MHLSHLRNVILISGLLASSARAQTSEQVSFWKKTVAEKSLGEISRSLSDSTVPRWPRVESVDSIQDLAGPQRGLAGESIGLVKSLHAKVRDDISRSGQGKAVDPTVCAALANGLEAAGGYSNWLLADSMRKLAILRLSEWLVRGSRPVAEVRKELGSLSVPRVEMRRLLEQFTSEDKALRERRAELTAITPDQNIFAAYNAARLGDPTSMLTQRFSQLIEEPSGGALVLRMAQTELLYTVDLLGLIVFLEKGGKYSELDAADIRPFKNRMGGAEKLFRYPLFGIRYLRGSDVSFLFDLHNKPQAREAFLRTALE